MLTLEMNSLLSSEDVTGLYNESLFSSIELYTCENTTATVPTGRSTSVTCLQLDTQVIKREHLLYGRPFFNEDKDQKFIIVTQNTAEVLFGRLNIIGEYLQINDYSYQVLGVLRHPQKVSKLLSHYNNSYVFVLREEQVPVLYAVATLQPDISGDFALSWLTRQPLLFSKVHTVTNLQIEAHLIGIYARVFLLLYTFLLFKMIRCRWAPLSKRLRINLHFKWSTLYPLPFFCQEFCSILKFIIIEMIPWLFLTIALRLLFNIQNIPPCFRPTRLMLSNIKQAFYSFVNYINTRGNYACFFTRELTWLRLEICVIGITGFIIFSYLTRMQFLNREERII